jgi:hypothetical protein
LKLCANLADILKDENLLPPALIDVMGGYEFEWKAAAPHQNIRAKKGGATTVYMGEEVTLEMVKA